MTHRYGNMWDAVECAAYDLLVTVDKHCREHRVRGGAHWVRGGAHWVRGGAHWVRGGAHWVRGGAHWVRGGAHWVRGGGVCMQWRWSESTASSSSPTCFPQHIQLFALLLAQELPAVTFRYALTLTDVAYSLPWRNARDFELLAKVLYPFLEVSLLLSDTHTRYCPLSPD